MGNLLGKALLGKRDEQGKKLQAISIATGIPVPRLSEIENGKSPTLEMLVRLSNGYDLAFREAVDLWILDQAETNSTRDLVRAHITAPQEQVSQLEIANLLKRLSANKELSKTVEKVIDSLDATKKELLIAIGKISQLRVVGERRAKSIIYPKDAEWSTHVLGPGVEKDVLFAATRPTPFVVELNRVAPRAAAIHRQADLPYAPASYEIWCVLDNEGVVALDDNGSWSHQKVRPGSCGYYWGGQRHIWVNPSHSSQMIILHAFFPYRKSEVGPGQAGEVLFVCLDRLPDTLSDDIRSALLSFTKQR